MAAVNIVIGPIKDDPKRKADKQDHTLPLFSFGTSNSTSNQHGDFTRKER